MSLQERRQILVRVHDGGMAMGKRGDDQEGLLVAYTEPPGSSGHPFNVALDRELRTRGFDRYVERECAKFYAPTMGARV